MRSMKLVLTTLSGLASALLLVSRAEAQVVVDFSYTGSNQTFVVPDNVSSIFVKLWGAGGGGRFGGQGGGCGFTSGSLAVTPGETLILIVGGGGSISGGGGFGGGGNSGIVGGGGRTALRILNGLDDLADAGGGGGGALSNGGAGGGTSGMAGSPSGLGGGGGSQSASGGGGAFGGQAGSQYQGGIGSNSGGGGGYFGGGGGGFAPSGGFFAAGGGGSGFVGNLTGAVTLAGSGTASANTSDIDYITGVGVGGNDSNGGNGYAVFRYIVNSSSVPEPGTYALLASLGVSSLYAIRRLRRSR